MLRWLAPWRWPGVRDWPVTRPAVLVISLGSLLMGPFADASTGSPSPPADIAAVDADPPSHALALGLIVEYRVGVSPVQPDGSPTGAREVAAVLDAGRVSSHRLGRLPDGSPAGASLPHVHLSTGGVHLGGTRTVRFDRPLDVADAAVVAEAIRRDPRVRSAQLDLLLEAAEAPVEPPQVVPNDPLFGEQGSLDEPAPSSEAALSMPRIWEATRLDDPPPVVAVLDTGSTDHDDLRERWVQGYDFISNSRLAVDGGGRDDDPTDPGDGCGGGPDSWHGSQVAGIIGATVGNGIGVAGIVPNARLQPVRVLGACGGSTADVADGIAWAAGEPVPGVPANPTPAAVINLSLGGLGPCPSNGVLQRGIDAATRRGAVVVVAAGNQSRDAAEFTPANCAGVLTVASVALDGSLATYSNTGPAVDLAAPGGETDPTTEHADGGVLSTVKLPDGADGYVRDQGTSLATPHVSGAVALLLAHGGLDIPDLGSTGRYVTERLRATAQSFPAPTGDAADCSDPAVACGAGILDLAAALGVPRRPGPVGALRAMVGAAGVTLRFLPSAGVRTYAVTLHRTYGSGPDTTTRVSVGSAGAIGWDARRWVTVPVDYPEGWTADAVESVTVAAVDEGGRVGVPVTREPDLGEPSRPASVHVEAARRTIAVDWVAPTDSGLAPVTGYRVRITRDWGGPAVVRVVDAKVTGLGAVDVSPGVPLTVSVEALSRLGPSAPRSATPVIAGLPGPPTRLTATPARHAVAVSWSRVSVPGIEPVVGYLVTSSGGDSVAVTGTTASVPITGDGDALVIRVAALTRVTADPRFLHWARVEHWTVDVPEPPQSPVAAFEGAALRVRWLPPAALHGTPVTGYELSARTAGAETGRWGSWAVVARTPASATEWVVPGLPGGVRVQIRVSALSLPGSSDPAEAGAVVRILPPGAPESVTLAARSRSLRLNWSVPRSLGGAPIDRYVAEVQALAGQSDPPGTGRRFDLAPDTAWTDFGGLTNGRTYRVRLAAVNGAGVGRWSAWVQGTPTAAPLAPGSPTARSVRGWVAATWTPAAVREAPITGYRVEVSRDGRVWNLAARTAGDQFTVSWRAPAAGIYRVRIAAQSNAGAGPWSPEVVVRV